MTACMTALQGCWHASHFYQLLHSLLRCLVAGPLLLGDAGDLLGGSSYRRHRRTLPHRSRTLPVGHAPTQF